MKNSEDYFNIDKFLLPYLYATNNYGSKRNITKDGINLNIVAATNRLKRKQYYQTHKVHVRGSKEAIYNLLSSIADNIIHVSHVYSMEHSLSVRQSAKKLFGTKHGYENRYLGRYNLNEYDKRDHYYATDFLNKNDIAIDLGVSTRKASRILKPVTKYNSYGNDENHLGGSLIIQLWHVIEYRPQIDLVTRTLKKRQHSNYMGNNVALGKNIYGKRYKPQNVVSKYDYLYFIQNNYRRKLLNSKQRKNTIQDYVHHYSKSRLANSLINAQNMYKTASQEDYWDMKYFFNSGLANSISNKARYISNAIKHRNGYSNRKFDSYVQLQDSMEDTNYFDSGDKYTSEMYNDDKQANFYYYRLSKDNKFFLNNIYGTTIRTLKNPSALLKEEFVIEDLKQHNKSKQSWSFIRVSPTTIDPFGAKWNYHDDINQINSNASAYIRHTYHGSKMASYKSSLSASASSSATNSFNSYTINFVNEYFPHRHPIKTMSEANHVEKSNVSDFHKYLTSKFYNYLSSKSNKQNKEDFNSLFDNNFLSHSSSTNSSNSNNSGSGSSSFDSNDLPF